MSHYTNNSWQPAASSNSNASANQTAANATNGLFNNPASLLFGLNNLATIPNLQVLVPSLLQQTNSSTNNSSVNSSSFNQSSSSWTSGSSRNSNTSSNNRSSLSNKNEPRPLMEIDTLKRNDVSKSTNSVSSSNSSSRYDSTSRPNSSNIRNNNPPTTTNNNTLNTLMTQNPLVAQVLNQLTASQTSNNLITALASSLVNSAASVPVPNNSTNNKDQQQSRTRDNRSSSLRRSMTRRSTRSPSSSRQNNNKKRTISRSPTNSSHKRSTNYQASKDGTNTSSSNTNSNKNTSSSNTKSSSSSSKYTIKLPKYQINNETNSVSTLKHRSQELYIPSEFSNSKNSYLSSLPLNRSLKFQQRCQFHIMRKEAKQIIENKAIYDPPDADHSWTVKVMLLAMPNMEELCKRTCEMAEDIHLNNRYEHPSKVIQFLVGNKGGKHDLMALGGPWSKSLDGPNPESNNQTLINTAIRTVKALTGIDLSACTQWYRFLDIQYNRNEEYKPVKESSAEPTLDQNQNGIDDSIHKPSLTFNDDPDIETTVIFLPNVWSLMPNSLEYQKIVESYKSLIDCENIESMTPSSSILSNGTYTEHSKQDNSESVSKDNESFSSEGILKTTNVSTTAPATPSKGNGDLDSTLLSDSETSNITINSLMQQSQNEIKPEPTHYSKIDLKKIKVDELRSELLARNLDTKGLKAQLLQRLKDSLEEEREKDEKLNQENEIELSINDDSQSDMKDELLITPHNDSLDIHANNNNDSAPAKKNENGKLNEKQNPDLTKAANQAPKLSRNERERLYKIPVDPHLIVHPTPTSKYNKFDCQLVSLSNLLDYRREDNKESIFEVSLFAECFNDMLMRDFSFIIYKHILSLKELNKNSKPTIETTTTTTTSNDSSKTPTSSIKPKTLHSDLLLAFTYFDTNRTNYIHYKDLEEILLSILGLNLTRSKVKYIFETRLNFKDNLLNYRHLTDSNQKYEIGFNLANEDDIMSNFVSCVSYMKRKMSSEEKNFGNNSDGVIEINGTTYDVLNTVKKLEKTELDLATLDSKLKESHSEMERIKIINKNFERQKLKAQDEIEVLKKKLREQERMNRDTYDRYSRFKDCVYRSKSQMTKFLDDINDVIKRGQLNSSSSSSSINANVSNGEQQQQQLQQQIETTSTITTDEKCQDDEQTIKAEPTVESIQIEEEPKELAENNESSK